MNILVCISVVADTTSKINISSQTKLFDPSGVQFIINPSDESALTRAIEIKEKDGASVSLINVGEAKDEPILRKAFSIGADSMIRVDTTAKDSYSVAKEIEAAVGSRNFDLILCGVENLDYHGGATPGILAALLGYNFVDNVSSVSVEDTGVVVHREVDGGREKVELSFPCILAVRKELIDDSELRIPSMRSIMQARTAQIEVVRAKEIEAKVSFTDMENPPKREDIKMIDKDNLEEIVEILLKEK